ncbi:MAG: M23 family metallopeptidase, partial [Gammaproteobacteria bacterium]
GDGDIVAAEFINRGITFQTVRFTSPTGENSYYTPDGNSMRKTFLRTPLKFSRITSRFNLQRKHPILNTIRAHKGVDYAAPTGTPVMAAGAGVIYFKGRKGGYGRAIIVRHGNRYRTLYGHLSRYARGIYDGKRVQQGQTIGYVGSSGMATGPHLHYEFLVDGVHRNPLTAPLPAAQPIPKRYRKDFKQQAEQLLARLRLVKSTTVAHLSP